MNPFLIVGGILVLGILVSFIILLVILNRRKRAKKKPPPTPPGQEMAPQKEIAPQKEVAPQRDALPQRECATCHRPLPPGSDICPVCEQTWGDSALADAADSAVSQEFTRPPRAHAALIGLSGPFEKRRFPIHLAPQGLTIGRNPDNALVIPDQLTVSRYHAQVIAEDGNFVLYDRDSANGTVVNNERVWRHTLQDNDQIQIGGVRFLFSRSGQIPARVQTPPSAPAPADGLLFQPQSEFEGFILEAPLGKGGMSVVYKARSREGETVALKILNVTDEYAVRKFVQEQQIGAVLRGHPYIRTVYSLGRSQSRHLYLVMEYIDGYSLRHLVTGQLSDEEIVRIIGQTCLALSYAHEQQIIHRDIKPENILVTQEGVVKVTDFGIAKLTSSVTVTSDHVVGTPEYLSPEQARGEQNIQPMSDVYSLGIVLYELLTGRVPFPLPPLPDPYQAAITVLRQHVATPPPLPRQRNPMVTPRLEQVALRAIAKNPRQRFPTAAVMGTELGYQEPAEYWQATEPIPQFSLLVTAGACQGRRIAVEARELTMGRADLDPGDTYLSRRHITLSLRGPQLWLEDTSLNGTYVNGERVFGERLLRVGDEIKLGRHVLLVTSELRKE